MSSLSVCIFHTRCSLKSQSCFYNDPNQDNTIRYFDNSPSQCPSKGKEQGPYEASETETHGSDNPTTESDPGERQTRKKSEKSVDRIKLYKFS